jgi:hypothetical protein
MSRKNGVLLSSLRLSSLPYALATEKMGRESEMANTAVTQDVYGSRKERAMRRQPLGVRCKSPSGVAVSITRWSVRNCVERTGDRRRVGDLPGEFSAKLYLNAAYGLMDS